MRVKINCVFVFYCSDIVRNTVKRERVREKERKTRCSCSTQVGSIGLWSPSPHSAVSFLLSSHLTKSLPLTRRKYGNRETDVSQNSPSSNWDNHHDYHLNMELRIGACRERIRRAKLIREKEKSLGISHSISATDWHRVYHLEKHNLEAVFNIAAYYLS